MISDHLMSSDTARLLLKIAREHHFSIDDLEDWKRHLDWREFEGWLEMFLKVESGEGRDIGLRLQAEAPHPYRECANDNRDDRRVVRLTNYNRSRSKNLRGFITVVSLPSPPQLPSETLHGRSSFDEGQPVERESKIIAAESTPFWPISPLPL